MCLDGKICSALNGRILVPLNFSMSGNHLKVMLMNILHKLGSQKRNDVPSFTVGKLRFS